MKAWTAFAAAFVLAACIENPGVDEGLATRHHKVSAWADRHPLQVRLERVSGVTRMYMRNAGRNRFDSIAYLIQAPRTRGYGTRSLPFSPVPYFDEEAFFEVRGTLSHLEAREETELGTIQSALPRELDGLRMRFISIHAESAVDPEENALDGYYQGRFVSRNPSGAVDSGVLRGMISEWGYFFWLRPGPKGWIESPLWGRIHGDSIFEAAYRDTLRWTAASSREGVAIVPVPGSDSIRFRMELKGPNSAPDDSSFTLDIAAIESKATRWYYERYDYRDDPYAPDAPAAIPSP